MVEINDSTLTFENVYNSEYAPKDNELKQANLLLLPYHNYREGVEYSFGENAEEFLRYIESHDHAEIKPDIAISDDKYQSMEMHSLLLDVGIFIVQNVALPMAVSLLANYVYDKIKSLHETKENVNVRVEIISENKDGKSKSIKYDGPATQFHEVEDAANKIIEEK